jgi:hypothetical protein
MVPGTGLVWSGVGVECRWDQLSGKLVKGNEPSTRTVTFPLVQSSNRAFERPSPPKHEGAIAFPPCQITRLAGAPKSTWNPFPCSSAAANQRSIMLGISRAFSIPFCFVRRRSLGASPVAGLGMPRHDLHAKLSPSTCQIWRSPIRLEVELGSALLA